VTEPEHHAESVVGGILRSGVILAASVVSTGAVLYLLRHGREPARFGTFVEETADLRLPLEIFRRAFAGSPRGIMQAGLILLIATPIARVAASVYLFARERDRLYVAVTLAVLGILLYSLTSGTLP